jgi:hypothetical protein
VGFTLKNSIIDGIERFDHASAGKVGRNPPGRASWVTKSFLCGRTIAAWIGVPCIKDDFVTNRGRDGVCDGRHSHQRHGEENGIGPWRDVLRCSRPCSLTQLRDEWFQIRRMACAEV